MIESRFDQAPHHVENGVITYSHAVLLRRYADSKVEESLQIKTDGTPIGYRKAQNYHGPGIDLEFRDWKGGSGQIAVADCPAGSSTELSEQNPAILMHQILMEHISQTDFGDLAEMPHPMILAAEEKGVEPEVLLFA